MSAVESGVAALIAKFGVAKLLTFGAALSGAAIMAIFRPPKTRKEVLQHGLVALVGSYLFGPFLSQLVANWSGVPIEECLIPVHGMVGALSWGAFSGIATWRDKLASNPKEAIQDVKDSL